MGNRATLLTFSAAALAALPLSAFAATTNFFGPIVPQGGQCLCPNTAMDWGCLLQVFQGILNFLVSFSLLAVVFFIAWGGFTLITSGGNPAARTKATNRMLNAVVGLVLILGSWLIVDTVMKYLYNPSTAFQGGAQFGPWNTILGSDPNAFCLRYNANPGLLSNGLNGNPISIVQNILAGPGISNSSTAANLGKGDCSPETLKTGAAQGGYKLTDAQAQTLSCIAIPESSCGTNRSIPHTPEGDPTSARGMFQIVLGGSDTCHSLNLPVCTQAAQKVGWTGGQLNCSAAFSGGKPKPGQEARAAACQAAALNTACNVSAAACLLQKDPSFGDWAGSQRADTRATAQASCVRKYNT